MELIGSRHWSQKITIVEKGFFLAGYQTYWEIIGGSKRPGNLSRYWASIILLLDFSTRNIFGLIRFFYIYYL